MCVIMAFEDNYPTKDILVSAETMNSHGGGMAWIDSAKGVVCWEKGMHVKADFIMDKIEQENIQLPIIVHFRIATHGTVDTPLCHPFALTEGNDDLASSGVDSEGVLFHNGVWTDYSDYALKVSMNKGIKIPDGDISDSRIMAWLVEHLGENYLSFIDEKVLLLKPTGVLRFGDQWTKVDMKVEKDVKKEGKVEVVCSNDSFDHTWGTNSHSISTFDEDDYSVYDTDGYSYYGDSRDAYSHKMWAQEKKDQKADFQVASEMDEEVESNNEARKREAMDELAELNLGATNLEVGNPVDARESLEEYEDAYKHLEKEREDDRERFVDSMCMQNELGEYAFVDGKFIKMKQNSLEDY